MTIPFDAKKVKKRILRVKLPSAKLPAKILLFLLLAACRQEPDPNPASMKVFGARGDDFATAMSATDDGGYLLMGTTTEGAGGSDGFMLKLDKDGNKEWYQTYGGQYEDHIFYGRSTPDGGYIGVGYTYSFPGDSGVAFGLASDLYIVKTGPRGEFQWSKVYNLSDEKLHDQAYCVQVDAGGNYFINGSTYNKSPGPYGRQLNGFLLKLDPMGEKLWVKNIGVRYNDYAWWNSIDRNNDCLLAGIMLDTVAADYRMYLMKTDSSGQQKWAYRYPHFRDVHGQMVREAKTALGGYLLIGYTGLYKADTKGVAIRVNENGLPYWARDYRVNGEARFISFDIASDNTFVIGGYTRGNLQDVWRPFLMKLDDFGNPIWTKVYGGNMGGGLSDMVATKDGGFAFVSSTTRKTTSFDDIYFFRTDKDGNLK